jgi:hypothetical protein
MNTETKIISNCLGLVMAILTLAMREALMILILIHIDATNTMWILFWVQMPIMVIIMVASKILKID